MLPEGMPLYNYPLKKSRISEIIADSHKMLGREATLEIPLEPVEFGHTERAQIDRRAAWRRPSPRRPVSCWSSRRPSATTC